MEIRALREEDLPLVAELEQACFSSPWSEESLRLLVSADALAAVCVEEGRALAYAGMTVSFDEGAITDVATLPAYRRQGLGEAVLRFLLAAGKDRGVSNFALEVRESNLSAIHLYQKLGFTIAGKRPRFYTHPPETALVMILKK